MLFSSTSTTTSLTTTNGMINGRKDEENPFITVKKATPSPPKSSQASTSKSPVAGGPSVKPCRLLYRGFLAIPDSEMVLDGISFVTSASLSSLASSPIPLTLESQRNRALKFVGTVACNDPKLGGTLDQSNAVRMYVHPLALLSVSFFEMLFCTKDPGLEGLSEFAVRAGLGDSHKPSDSDLFIYARLSQDSRPNQPSTMELHLTQLIQSPPSPQKPAFAPRRVPRPDDPTPRIPPAMLLQPRGSPGRKGLKRVRSDSLAALSQRDVERKRAKGHITVDRDKIGRGKGKGRIDAQGYRIPDDPEPPDNRTAGDDPFLVTSENQGDTGGTERSNKELVNRVTKKVLQSHGVAKAHAEYKEILAWIYRGTLFAFRSKSKIKPLAPDEVAILVERHAGMYIPPSSHPI